MLYPTPLAGQSARIMESVGSNQSTADQNGSGAASDHDMDLDLLFNANTAIEQQTFKVQCYHQDDDDSPPTSPDEEEYSNKYLVFQLFCSSSACTDYDLTGQIVWPVSVLLSHYLASTRGTSLLSGKNVVELGSGVGLPGFVASKFANKVLLTDGNDFVVDSILKRSVSFHNTKMTDSTRVESSSSHCTNNISVQKFIWGDKEQLKGILEDFGTVDVIVAADVVQWPSVLEPFLHSCKALLWKSSKPLLVLGLVQRAQSTYREFFKVASQLGFTWEKVPYKIFLPGGVLPDACQEYGVGKPEIYELQLASRMNPPKLLNDAEDQSTSVTGFKYQFSSLPC